MAFTYTNQTCQEKYGGRTGGKVYYFKKISQEIYTPEHAS